MIVTPGAGSGPKEDRFKFENENNGRTRDEELKMVKIEIARGDEVEALF